MGPADYRRALDGKDGAFSLAHWWEKDPTSDVWTPEGDRKGVRNIVTAHFDKEGLLFSLVVVYRDLDAFETVGRSVHDWRYRGP